MKLSKLIFVYSLLAAAPAFADILDDDDDNTKKPPASAPAPDEQKPSPPSAGPGAPKGQKPNKPASLPKDEADKPHATGKGGVLAPKGGAVRKPGQVRDADQPVEWQSEGLKGMREKGFVELEKNVVVTQGSMRLEADHAEAYFDEGSKEVVKIICNGNVKMFKDDEDSGEKIKAYGDSVVFLNKDRRATMEGNARLWRGSDLVRGKKIIYEMDTGWIRGDRVAGELHSGDKDVKP